MRKIRIDNEWGRCSKCGHKLFKITNNAAESLLTVGTGLEFKCHSCKTVNYLGLPQDLPEEWVFTFGCGHEHAGHYVRFTGTYSEARKKMTEAYGDRWAFQYSAEEWEMNEIEAKMMGRPIETELRA